MQCWYYNKRCHFPSLIIKKEVSAINLLWWLSQYSLPFQPVRSFWLVIFAPCSGKFHTETWRMVAPSLLDLPHFAKSFPVLSPFCPPLRSRLTCEQEGGFSGTTPEHDWHFGFVTKPKHFQKTKIEITPRLKCKWELFYFPEVRKQKVLVPTESETKMLFHLEMFNESNHRS